MPTSIRHDAGTVRHWIRSDDRDPANGTDSPALHGRVVAQHVPGIRSTPRRGRSWAAGMARQLDKSERRRCGRREGAISAE